LQKNLANFEENLIFAKEGDSAAFEKLFNHFRAKIRYYSLYNGKFDSELEGLQFETLLRCIKKFDIDWEEEEEWIKRKAK